MLRNFGSEELLIKKAGTNTASAMSCDEERAVPDAATQPCQRGGIDPGSGSRLQNASFSHFFAALFAFPVFQRAG